MKNFAAFVAVLSFSGCCEQIEGNGVLVSEERDVQPFTNVSVSNALVATVENGDTGVSLRMDENLLDYVRTRVEGDTLFVDLDEWVSIEPSDGARIFVRSPRVDGVEVSGSSVVAVTTRCDDVSLEVSGASVLRASVDADDIDLEVSGASDATLFGTATTLRVEASGASVVESTSDAAEIDVDASGASEVSILATAKARVHASGASEVEVGGNPAERDQESSGSSTIRWQ